MVRNLIRLTTFYRRFERLAPSDSQLRWTRGAGASQEATLTCYEFTFNEFDRYQMIVIMIRIEDFFAEMFSDINR